MILQNTEIRLANKVVLTQRDIKLEKLPNFAKLLSEGVFSSGIATFYEPHHWQIILMPFFVCIAFPSLDSFVNSVLFGGRGEQISAEFCIPLEDVWF